MPTPDSIPATMRAFVLKGHGDMDQLVYHTDWTTPQPCPGEVLLKVHACGLNNTDVNTRTAWYSKGVSENTTGGAFDDADDEDATWGGAAVTFPHIKGADAVGTVIATGDGANPDLPGKRALMDVWLRDWDNPLDLDKCGYFGSECDGGFADCLKIDQRHVHPIESCLEHAELATSYVTAENMINRAQVLAADTVLIPGASGGIGSALIQLANRRGAQTIAMASESKHDKVQKAGPTAILPRSPDNPKSALKKAVAQEAVTVVADVVNGPDWPRFIDMIARGGWYTCAGAIAGRIVDFDLRTFYLRDLTFTGATIVPPGVFADLVSYIASDEIKPMLAATYPLVDLHEAQQAFIDKQQLGNIVVTMD